VSWKPEGNASVLSSVVHGRGRRLTGCAAIALSALVGGLVVWSPSGQAHAADPAVSRTVPNTTAQQFAEMPYVSPPTAASTTTTSPSTTVVPETVPTTEATVATTTSTSAETEVVPETSPTAETVVAVTTTTAIESLPVAEDTVAVATTNQSGCRSDRPGAVMSIAIADISYACSVYVGGQAVLDTGAATLLTDVGPSPFFARHPADPGTLWIAGHRTSHGSPFADVPDLADGAIITVSDANGAASYRVVGRSYVQVRDGLVIDSSGNATESATQASILRTDRGGNLAPRLVLQTCDGNANRWIIYADLVRD
jgi:sortase A